MSTKAKKAAPAPKSAPAKAEKASGGKKGGKASVEIVEIEMSSTTVVEGEDEGDDEEEMSGGSSSGGGGNAAALAAATGSAESASFKNFRHHPDMENFYRFIYENDLRLEALTIIDEIQNQKALQKNVKLAKKNAH
jgi:hypothetical protein